ncbi:peptide-methionine (R)-S-oxide reductase [Faunimonas pinastri]|uniref:peptide-methionine (R)-S-oxide reductase n=1 Tax=Faunimonas pinastri TaxID=1855383 RepID=A0A1H8ZZS9_9HYPH|nr:peptide-methionine (R)-S-oxide reductase MsrB [Faunimonas pinastri]SEP69855.1 peptide-methionine (R)-S-oxide reductase [Faunimonas pinastri]
MLNKREFLFRSAGLGLAVPLGLRAGWVGTAAAAAYSVSHSDAEWKKLLSPAAYHVLRREGTERAYSSPLNDEHRKGVFACAGCNQAAFSSDAKFDSGTGWPSFTRALPGAVGTGQDHRLMMARTEVHCSRCGGHLGHVFDDGPAPTGKRFCMNGVAMTFKPGATA